MEDKEKIYDDQIFPLMGTIIEVCKEHKIPFFASFQYSNDGFVSSNRRDGHAVFNYYEAVRQSIEEDGINIDKFILWVMREAEKIGHSSIILSQLDVPMSPNEARHEVAIHRSRLNENLDKNYM